MNYPELEKDRLERELQLAKTAFQKEYKSFSSSWSVTLGSFSVKARIGTESIIGAFVAFNALCFAVGIVFSLQEGALQAVGVALIVGGLFSFGTFMAQWWDHAWQRQNDAINGAFEKERYENLRRLAGKARKLSEEIDGLPNSSDQGGGHCP